MALSHLLLSQRTLCLSGSINYIYSIRASVSLDNELTASCEQNLQFGRSRSKHPGRIDIAIKLFLAQGF